MALCPECALIMATPVTYTRDRCAYVVDLTLYAVESTAFTRQGSLVQIQPRPPFSTAFSVLSLVLFFSEFFVCKNFVVSHRTMQVIWR